jgi:hypothetical protein
MDGLDAESSIIIGRSVGQMAHRWQGRVAGPLGPKDHIAAIFRSFPRQPGQGAVGWNAGFGGLKWIGA